MTTKGRRTAGRAARRAATSSEAIHFRMPSALHKRLKYFAEERSLGDAEALRLALSERLNQVDEERELSAAERWQHQQAWATWQRIERGEEELLEPEEIHRVFAPPTPPRRRRTRSTE